MKYFPQMCHPRAWRMKVRYMKTWTMTPVSPPELYMTIKPVSYSLKQKLQNFNYPRQINEKKFEFYISI